MCVDWNNLDGSTLERLAVPDAASRLGIAFRRSLGGEVWCTIADYFCNFQVESSTLFTIRQLLMAT